MSATTIKVRGLEYALKRVEENGEVCYHLDGTRGAQYATMRNVNTPHMMFLVSRRAFGIPKQLERVWLSDKNGNLVVLAS